MFHSRTLHTFPLPLQNSLSVLVVATLHEILELDVKTCLERDRGLKEEEEGANFIMGTNYGANFIMPGRSIRVPAWCLAMRCVLY